MFASPRVLEFQIRSVSKQTRTQVTAEDGNCSASWESHSHPRERACPREMALPPEASREETGFNCAKEAQGFVLQPSPRTPKVQTRSSQTGCPAQSPRATRSPCPHAGGTSSAIATCGQGFRGHEACAWGDPLEEDGREFVRLRSRRRPGNNGATCGGPLPLRRGGPRSPFRRCGLGRGRDAGKAVLGEFWRDPPPQAQRARAAAWAEPRSRVARAFVSAVLTIQGDMCLKRQTFRRARVAVLFSVAGLPRAAPAPAPGPLHTEVSFPVTVANR